MTSGAEGPRPGRKTIAGYSDRLTVRPGGTVAFKVSADDEQVVTARLVRLTGPPAPDRSHVRHLPSPIDGRHAVGPQPIRRGSAAVVPTTGRPMVSGSFTIQVAMWPTRPGTRQAIAGTWSEVDGSGFALELEESGRVALVVGDGRGGVWRVRTERSVGRRRWVLVGGSYDAGSGRMAVGVRQREAAALWPHPDHRDDLAVGDAAPGLSLFNGDLRFAAFAGRDGALDAHFNGKLERPRVVWPTADPTTVLSDDLLGDVVEWDFSRGIGTDRIHDVSGRGHHGSTVNLPTRAVTGVRWTGDEQDWRVHPWAYGAIHFHDDDLYDCGWNTDFELPVADDAHSGVYAVELLADNGAREELPFVVTPGGATARKDVALLLPTATYMAYANETILLGDPAIFGEDAYEPTTNDDYVRGHPEVGLSLYDHHADGSGVAYSSRLRPMLTMRSDARNWGFRSDLNIIGWLTSRHVDFDVLTDEDLHSEGSRLLDGYRVVLTGSHPEYYSTPMLDALTAYVGGGGRLMYLGGNGFYWRIAFHQTLPGVIEVRRAEDGTRAWASQPGEYHHEFTGEYGGMWRRLGRAPNQLVGIGFSAQGDFGRSGYYRRTEASRDPSVAFVFEGLDDVEVFGRFGEIGGGAVGQEIDRYDPRLGSPLETHVLATSEGLPGGLLRVKEDFLATSRPDPDPLVRADMVLLPVPSCGAVFSVGSIAWAGSLPENDFDNEISTITENVLQRFLDPAPIRSDNCRTQR